jgi:hypothetical protein
MVGRLGFWTYNNSWVERMSISGTDGNVGIGTTSPGAKLDVVGNIILGTQANRATITYPTNTARTFTIPNTGANADFVMTQGDQTMAGVKTFSSTPQIVAATQMAAITHIPVFTADPSNIAKSIFSSTPTNFRGGLGLGFTTGALPIANGGTNATSVAQGGIIYGASTTAYASTAAGTTGQYLESNGSGAPSWTRISYTQRLVNKTGLVATLATGTNIVTLTSGNTSELLRNQVLSKTSGAGVFGTGARIGTINSSTQFTVINGVGNTLNHVTAGSITFTAFGTARTEETTTAMQVFEVNIPAGNYRFELVGSINKIGTVNKRYEVYITFLAVGASTINGIVNFSPATAYTSVTGNAMSSMNSTFITTATTSLTSLSGQGFAGTTNTTQTSNMPFHTVGLISCDTTRTVYVHIKQNGSGGGNRIEMNERSFFTITKI